MKKINSIWYGAAVLGWGVLFAVVLPLLLYGISYVLRLGVYLLSIIRISVAIGIFILLIFSLLLTMELIQDKRINKMYEGKRKTKVEISDGFFECQNCGNQKVKKDDAMCPICGTVFR